MFTGKSVDGLIRSMFHRDQGGRTQAEKYFRDKKWKKALSLYSEINHKEPDDMAVAVLVAQLHEKCKEPQAALQKYAQIAETYVTVRKFAKAASIYNQMLNLEPDNLNHRENLVRMALQEYSQEQDEKKKRKLSTRTAMQLHNLSQTMIEKGKLTKALHYLRSAIKISPTNWAAALQLTDKLVQRKQTRQAMDCLKDIAEQLIKRNMLDEAHALLMRAKKIQPNEPEARAMLLVIQVREGHPQGMARLQNLHLEHSENLKIILYLARLNFSLNHLSQARDWFLRAFHLGYDRVQELVEIGTQLLQRGKLEDAIAALNPVAIKLYRQQKYAEAARILEPIYSANPYHLPVLLSLYKISKGDGQDHLTMEYLERIIHIYTLRNQPVECMTFVNELLDFDPDSSELRDKVRRLTGSMLTFGVDEPIRVQPEPKKINKFQVAS